MLRLLRHSTGRKAVSFIIYVFVCENLFRPHEIVTELREKNCFAAVRDGRISLFTQTITPCSCFNKKIEQQNTRSNLNKPQVKVKRGNKRTVKLLALKKLNWQPSRKNKSSKQPKKIKQTQKNTRNQKLFRSEMTSAL